MDRLLVIRAEAMYANPSKVLREQVAPFLSLDATDAAWSTANLARVFTNSGGHGQHENGKLDVVEQLEQEGSLDARMASHAVDPSLTAPAITDDDRAVLKELQQLYAPWNQQLQQVLGKEAAAVFGDWTYE